MEETSISAGVAERLAKVGLQREPFMGAGADELYFADPGARQRLDLLYHLAPYSQLLLVTGETGVGKSALMRRFLSRANENWRVCLAQSQPEMDAQTLLHAAHAGFNLTGEEPGDMQAALRTFIEQLRALRYNSQTPLLIIDNAERLANSGLELVQHLCEAGADGMVASIILLGDATLNTRLAQPEFEGLRSFVAHRFELQPLSEEDTAAYIHFRMSAAGFTGDSPFGTQVIKRVYKASRGIPAKINELAHDVLIDEAVRKSDLPPAGPRSAPPASQGRWALVGVGVAAIGLILWWQGRSGPNAPGVPAQKSVTVNIPLPPPAPAPVEVAPPPPAPATVPDVPATQAEAPPPASASPEHVAQAPAPAAPRPPVTTPPPAAKLEVVPPKPETLPPKPVVSAPKPKPLPLKEAPPKTAPASAGGIKGLDWIRAQATNHYTVQLMAMPEEAAVRDFITAHQIQDRAAYFRVERNGQTFYALVYGSYPNRAQADAAAKELPASLGKLEPWVRSFKSAQVAAR